MTPPEDLPRALERELESHRGCFPAVVGGVALSLLAPLVAIVRGWHAWRRGGDWRIVRRESPVVEGGPGRLHCIELEADIPIRTAGNFATRLTDAVVRVAEALRQPDDAYLQIARLPGEPQTLVQPLGPQIQELGDRFVLALGRRELAGRTVLWLALPAARAISDVVDPTSYDPGADGEPHGRVESSGARWAAANARAQVGPSVIHRLVLWVPDGSTTVVASILDRLAGLQD